MEFNQIHCDIMNLSTSYLLDSQFLLKMNYCFDLWDIHAQDTPFKIFDSPFESHCFADLEFSDPAEEQDPDIGIYPSYEYVKTDLPLKPISCQHQNVSHFAEKLKKNREVVQSSSTKRAAKSRKKRIIKPSPYHNYQKHLNSTLKQLIRLPELQVYSPLYHSLAHDLWSVFKESTLSTKKILHFIFNEYNEYKITEKELGELGLVEIYVRSTHEELGQAKNYLTELTLSQLNEQNIDMYLSQRRIKDQLKFKKYLMLFRHQLEEGFIKKRFTNRSRKEQLKMNMCRQCCE